MRMWGNCMIGLGLEFLGSRRRGINEFCTWNL